MAWSTAEGGHYQNAARYNLLNTSRKTKHSYVAIGLDGIRGYDTYQDGIDATVETLELTTANGKPTGYPAILEALRHADSTQAVLSAAGNSVWAASHYRHTDWGGILVNASNQIATAKCN